MAEYTEHDVFVLEDAEGTAVEFAMLGIVELDDEGQFALMAPTWQLETDDESQLEVFIFRFHEDPEDGAVEFGPVEDEDLVARVGAIAEAQLFAVAEDEEADA